VRKLIRASAVTLGLAVGAVLAGGAVAQADDWQELGKYSTQGACHSAGVRYMEMFGQHGSDFRCDLVNADWVLFIK
jgi:hypothetical protein